MQTTKNREEEKIMTPDKAQSLANDLNCAIATLQAIADDLATAYPDSDYDRDDTGTICGTVCHKSETPTEPPKPAVTLEQVRGVLADKSRGGHREAVQALLQQYGAERLSAVNPKHYADLLADAEGIE
jgi:hypothetical protein